MKKYRIPLIIFFMNLVFYALFNYGGIRSPDSEIVFRTTESLVLRNSFAVNDPIDWNYFGLSLGIDSQRYSIFGPVESIIAVPLLKIAYFLERNHYVIDSNYIPISHHLMADDNPAGIYFLEDKKPPSMNGHYVRFIVSFLNSIIGALAGVFLYFILIRLTKSEIVSLLTTFLFSFGTLFFPYTGTFFSEPLCTLFMIISFLFIIKNESGNSVKNIYRNYFFSGLFLGLATATHISAVLSIPFYYLIILGQKTKDKFNFKHFGFSNSYFTFGLIVFGALLLYYNFARFGNISETGRTVENDIYAYYSNPLPGLYGLLLSPGKGLFIYIPLVFLSFILWKSFHNQFPHLSIAIIGMIIIRLFFISSRSDWHGGFCLGPRYMIIIIPFFLLPIANGIKVILDKKEFKKYIIVGIFSFLCIIQQIYFSVGEIFSYLHIIYRQQKAIGIETLYNNSLYTNWQYSPVLYLLNYKTGPFILNFLQLNNYLFWVIMCLLFFIIFFIINYIVYKKSFK